MSDHASTSHEPHGEPHVLPLSVYFKTWGALLVLTAITVAASYVDFGSANIFIALGIATIKATLVALIFMHLLWDHKFHAVIFTMAVLFTVVFVAFTMFDTQTRGRTDAIRADHPITVTAPFSGTQSEERIREKFAEAPTTTGHDAHGERTGGHGNVDTLNKPGLPTTDGTPANSAIPPNGTTDAGVAMPGGLVTDAGAAPSGPVSTDGGAPLAPATSASAGSAASSAKPAASAAPATSAPTH